MAAGVNNPFDARAWMAALPRDVLMGRAPMPKWNVLDDDDDESGMDEIALEALDEIQTISRQIKALGNKFLGVDPVGPLTLECFQALHALVPATDRFENDYLLRTYNQVSNVWDLTYPEVATAAAELGEVELVKYFEGLVLKFSEFLYLFEALEVPVAAPETREEEEPEAPEEEGPEEDDP